MSQGGRAMLHVNEYFAKSLQVIRNDTHTKISVRTNSA